MHDTESPDAHKWKVDASCQGQQVGSLEGEYNPLSVQGYFFNLRVYRQHKSQFSEPDSWAEQEVVMFLLLP